MGVNRFLINLTFRTKYEVITMKLLNWIDRNIIGFDREEMNRTFDYWLVWLLPILLTTYILLKAFISN